MLIYLCAYYPEPERCGEGTRGTVTCKISWHERARNIGFIAEETGTEGLNYCSSTHTHTHTPFTEARDSEWQWHQLGRMQVCTSLQTDNHASTPPLSFFTDRMPFLPPNEQRQSTEGTLFIQFIVIMISKMNKTHTET